MSGCICQRDNNGNLIITDYCPISEECYFLEEELGKGSSGTAWLGSVLDRNNRVIRKVVLKQYKDTDYGRDGWIDESHVLQLLKEGGACDSNDILCYENHFLEINRDSGREYYLATKAIENAVSLSDYIEEKFCLENNMCGEEPEGIDIYEATDIILDVLQSYQKLHKMRIAQTDVKTENMLINSQTGKITIIDFDLNCFNHPNYVCHEVNGTEGYRAPEIYKLENPRFEDYRKADIYSLGIAMNFILTGNWTLYDYGSPAGARSIRKRHGGNDSENLTDDAIKEMIDLSFVPLANEHPLYQEYKGILIEALRIDPKERAELVDLIMMVNIIKNELEKEIKIQNLRNAPIQDPFLRI